MLNEPVRVTAYNWLSKTRSERTSPLLFERPIILPDAGSTKCKTPSKSPTTNC